MNNVLLPQPPRVTQNERRCWAAAFESWDRANANCFGIPACFDQGQLATWFDRTHGLTGHGGAATADGLSVIQSIGMMRVRSMVGARLTSDLLAEWLQISYVFCAYSWPASGGSRSGSHAMVLYGVQKETIFMMDPAAHRGLVREPVHFFHRPGIRAAFGVSLLADFRRGLDSTIASLQAG